MVYVYIYTHTSYIYTPYIYTHIYIIISYILIRIHHHIDIITCIYMVYVYIYDTKCQGDSEEKELQHVELQSSPSALVATPYISLLTIFVMTRQNMLEIPTFCGAAFLTEEPTEVWLPSPGKPSPRTEQNNDRAVALTMTGTSTS